jgi:hypothetical protein
MPENTAPTTATTPTTPTPPSASTPPPVPVGLATKTGYSVAIAGLIAAVLAYVSGDHSQAQLGSIVGASVGVVSLLITQVGRYVQANSSIKANVELKKLEHDAVSIVGLVKTDDPEAVAQLRTIVRGALQDVINELPAGDRPVAGDIENILLPSGQEEAASPPPPVGSPAAGGT